MVLLFSQVEASWISDFACIYGRIYLIQKVCTSLRVAAVRVQNTTPKNILMFGIQDPYDTFTQSAGLTARMNWVTRREGRFGQMDGIITAFMKKFTCPFLVDTCSIMSISILNDRPSHPYSGVEQCSRSSSDAS